MKKQITMRPYTFDEAIRERKFIGIDYGDRRAITVQVYNRDYRAMGVENFVSSHESPYQKDCVSGLISYASLEALFFDVHSKCPCYAFDSLTEAIEWLQKNNKS